MQPLLLAALAVLFLGCSPAEGSAGTPLPGNGVVLLELFTSQGCSSCPPADRLLSRVASEPAMSGRIISLSFHVDYWNYIGWRDPFSSPEWSQRQRRYTRSIGDDVYTPQLVINGRQALVGSNERAVREAIHKAAASPSVVTLEIRNVTRAEDELSIDVAARGVGKNQRVDLIIYERGLVTAVTRGENNGRTLRNDNVVRWLGTVDLTSDDPDEQRGLTTVTLENGWNRSALGVVLVAYEVDSLEVVGATAN